MKKAVHIRSILWLFIVLLLVLVSGCNFNVAPVPVTKEVTSSPTVKLPSATVVASPTPLPTKTLQPTLSKQPTMITSPIPTIYPLHGIEIHRLANIIPVKQAGAYLMRRNALLWSKIEPNEGDRNWQAQSALEIELKTASEQGLQVILIVRSTPLWAQKLPDYYCGPIKPEKLASFAAFMADLVARYSVPPYNVKYWELGNEPDVLPAEVPPDNLYGCWGQKEDPYNGGEYYAEMLKVTYPQIKASDPQAQVLVGGLAMICDPVNPPETLPGSGELVDCTATKFLEGILKNGGGKYFDGVSFHAYDYFGKKNGRYANNSWNSAWNTTGPTLVAKALYLRSLLTQYGVQDKFLMNTENGILCGSSGEESYCLTDAFKNMKASYLAECYAASLAVGLRTNVWFSITGWRGSGLLDDMGQPNSAFTAYHASVDRLNGASYKSEITVYPGVKGYEFTRGDLRVWVLWALDEAIHLVKLPKVPVAVYDVLGTPATISQEISVALAPIYIEWKP